MPELRASERLKKTATRLIGLDGTPAAPTTATSTSTHSSHTPSQRKRRKTSHKSNVATRRHKKGQLGLLSRMIDMPLDILYEVFSLLLPVDLLQLCRANKSLRKILLDRRATPIWKAAFSSLEFPPPAMLKDMSYPGYALLLFGEECHNCGNTKASYVHWANCLRLCGPCVRKLAVSHDRRDKRLQNLCPSWPVRMLDSGTYRTLYLKAEAEEIMQELERLKNTQYMLDNFIKARRVICNERVTFSNECRDWVSLLERNHEIQLQNLRNARTDAIIQRLNAEGWGDELKSLRSWDYHRIPGANEVDELNERTWKRIRPDATAFLQAKHAEVLGHNRRYLVGRRMALFELVYAQFLKDHPNQSPVIRFADLCAQEPFLSLIFTTPMTTEVTLADFEAKKSQISEISQVWFESRSRELKDLLPPELPSLDLAVAIFWCSWCREPIFFPRMLQHHCLINDHEGFKPADNNADIFGCFTRTQGKPWNFGGNQVQFDKTTLDHAKDVIALCGEDPLKATATFMDKLDCRLECLRCLHGKRSRTGRLVMPWSYTIVHEIQKHRDEDEQWEKPHWKLVENPQEIEFVKKRESFPYPVTIPLKSVLE